MVAISATMRAVPAVQSGTSKSQLEQARRDADQAELSAQTLRARADEQERVLTQSQQRVRTLEASVNAGSAPSAVAHAAPAAKPEPAASTPTEASYAQTLSTVFEAAKPLTSTPYSSSSQQDVVLSSLFQAADKLWSAPASTQRAIGLYRSQSEPAPAPAAGSVIDSSA